MSDISDQISEKSIAICVQAAKFDAKVLAAALDKLLKGGLKLHKNLTTPMDMTNKGKQTVKQLVRQGKGITNIDISTQNILLFQNVARKYGVDFALKKDNTVVPPKWLVFFKAQDATALTSAFREFVATQARRTSAKPSVLDTLKHFTHLVKNQVIDRVKDKVLGR
jgi:hypothetical protein